MKNKPNIKTQEVKPTPEQEATAKFGLEYSALCKKYNRVIAIEPFWHLERDGAYVLKINRFIRKEDPNGR